MIGKIVKLVEFSVICCFLLAALGAIILIWFNEIIGIKLFLTGLITGFFLSLIRLCLW